MIVFDRVCTSSAHVAHIKIAHAISIVQGIDEQLRIRWEADLDPTVRNDYSINDRLNCR